MVYTLCKYPDETEVVFSDIRKKLREGLICFLNMHVKEVLNLPSLLEIMRIQSLFLVKWAQWTYSCPCFKGKAI